jgi:hypothetical protein
MDDAFTVDISDVRDSLRGLLVGFAPERLLSMQAALSRGTDILTAFTIAFGIPGNAMGRRTAYLQKMLGEGLGRDIAHMDKTLMADIFYEVAEKKLEHMR